MLWAPLSGGYYGQRWRGKVGRVPAFVPSAVGRERRFHGLLRRLLPKIHQTFGARQHPIFAPEKSTLGKVTSDISELKALAASSVSSLERLRYQLNALF